VIEKAGWRVYFDGRCANQLGSGGFIAFDENGVVQGGKAMNFGVECKTNNAAELEALRRALEWLANRHVAAQHVAILGDSSLVVQFMNRQATPKRSHLANRVSAC
jgi:ribonuclease HI